MTPPILPDTLTDIDPYANFYRLTKHNVAQELCLVAINYDDKAANFVGDAKILNLTDGVTANADTLESNGVFNPLLHVVPASRVVLANSISFSPNTPGIMLATLASGGPIEIILNSVFYIRKTANFNELEIGELDLENIN